MKRGIKKNTNNIFFDFGLFLEAIVISLLQLNPISNAKKGRARLTNFKVGFLNKYIPGIFSYKNMYTEPNGSCNPLAKNKEISIIQEE